MHKVVSQNVINEKAINVEIISNLSRDYYSIVNTKSDSDLVETLQLYMYIHSQSCVNMYIEQVFELLLPL